MVDMKRPTSGESLPLTIKLHAIVGLNHLQGAEMARQTAVSKLLSPSVRSMTPNQLLLTPGPIRAFQSRFPHKSTDVMILFLAAMNLNASLRGAPGSLIASHAIDTPRRKPLTCDDLRVHPVRLIFLQPLRAISNTCSYYIKLTKRQ